MDKYNQDFKHTFEEYRKCQNDIVYFIQSYIFDFKLDEHQIKYLKNIANGNDAAIDKSIANIQELNLAFALWKILVNPCISIVVMSNDNKTKNLLVQRFKEMIDRLILSSMISEITLRTNLKYEIWLSNNSSIFFGDYANFECQLLGRSFSILILDNFSSLNKQNEFLQYVVPVVRSTKNNQIIGLFKNGN